MRKTTLRRLAAYSVITLLVLQSCKDDSTLITPVSTGNYSFNEEFDTASAALSRGWKFINASDPIGAAVWQNGGDVAAPFFNAYSNNGSNVGFIGASYLSTSAGAGAISNWAVSPSTYMQNGDKIVFYTKGWNIAGYTATDTTDFGNRLQLCINPGGDDVNVGLGYDEGNFITTLVDINPQQYERHRTTGTFNAVIYNQTMLDQSYPDEWTRFEGVVNGLKKPGYHRFAFRYLVTDGGNAGAGSGVGLDKVSYISIGK
ncbi:MAG: choice-of-anchor J domain-containing protein [Ferruginibacter sp.]